MPKTLIVSNRLPVKVQKADNEISFTPSAGGLATGLGSIYKEGESIWLGWPGLFIDEVEEQKFVTQELKKENMYPVFLSKKEIREFYEGFSNATLWPSFHYFNEYVVYNKVFWEAYCKVNAKFCEVITHLAEPGDIIWVHDYQLLLLPNMVRKQIQEVSIGFFQHIPFPSYEVFRQLPWRKELLEGMLGADLLGFHTYDDTRHFLSAVSRIVGVNNFNNVLELEERSVAVDAFPMGIDYAKYHNASKKKVVREKIEKLRHNLGDQKLCLSIDRLDYSKGIPQKLMAFEQLLIKYPQYEQQVSLVMIVVPSRHKVKKYRELKESIDEMVGRINSKFATLEWRPIHYFYRSFNFEDLSAFYHLAEVGFITPMRDGMNLVCKEFIASKTGENGVLILSEMAGASKELYDAILVNPNDEDALIDALYRALNMPKEEQLAYIKTMQYNLQVYDIHNWVSLFLDSLHNIVERQKLFSSRNLNQEIISEIESRYSASKNRIIIIDLDNFILHPDYSPSNLYIEELKERLDQISEDSHNIIVLVSGLDAKTMDKQFGNLNVDLVCEHGAIVKEYGQTWQISKKLKNEWKADIFPLMEHYVKRTPGSFIEEKEFSLVWHYKKVEAGLGEVRTRELSEHLKYLTTSMSLNIIEEDSTLEIKSARTNKGRVMNWLDKYPCDFLLIMGAHITTEDIFRGAPENAYTIKVGKSFGTNAKYRALNPGLAFNVLNKFILNKPTLKNGSHNR